MTTPRLATLFMGLALGLAACTDGSVRMPVDAAGQSDLAQHLQVVRLDTTNIGAFNLATDAPQPSHLATGSAWDYRLGRGDVLNIVVFDHPELTSIGSSTLSAAGAATSTSSPLAPFIVQPDGTFFYPFVGQIEALGRSPEEVRRDLTAKLATYIPSPQIEIHIAEFNSQSVVVAGEVAQPRAVPLTVRPLHLLDAINAAGGMTADANAADVKVLRGGKVHDVNLDAFLNNGLGPDNPLLLPGDVVTVPRMALSEAYVMGSVRTPSAVNLAQGPVTLTQALSRQGGLDEQRADARGVFVFRLSGQQMTVYQLDASLPGGWLLGDRFQLRSGDVIYVTRSPLSAWNDTISRLLPSVTATRTVGSAPN